VIDEAKKVNSSEPRIDQQVFSVIKSICPLWPFLLLVVDVPKWFFDSVSDLAKQLITVSTGVLRLSITFLKDIVKVNPEVNFKPLVWSWVLYILSIIFGLWTLLAVTGAIERLLLNQNSSPVIDNMRFPAGSQIVLFISATICLMCYVTVGGNMTVGGL